MSIPHLSTEQRVQQLESTVMDLMSQVSGLTRELQAARTQQERLQVACDSYQFAEGYIDEAIAEQIPNLQQRVGRIEDELGIYEEDEEQPVGSD
jgi:predicted  nucleic acid-binding Zn-ribbon protein